MPTSKGWGSALALACTLSIGGCALAPEPLTEVELKEQAAHRIAGLETAHVPVNGTLTLSEAISRAVQYNLDHRAEMLEIALKEAELDVAGAEMLPSLVAGAQSNNRDRPSASSSYNLVTGVQNFGHSTSQDEHLRIADLELSWSVLDFGLTYVRARQAADKVLIAAETRRRIVHAIVEEVRTTYWRAWAAQAMRERLRRIEARAREALSASRKQADDRSTSPLVAVTYRRELMDIQRTLQQIERDLATASVELASLINEAPDAKLTLASPPAGSGAAGLAAHDAGSLIAIALEQRPELRELSYRKRINLRELDAALIELLPGISPYAGANFDSNSFLLHSNWLSWGARASWNVMRLFQYPRRRHMIEAQQEVLEQRDLATALAVVTQVHVSRARVALLSRERETARAYLETQNELLSLVRAGSSADKISEQSLLREELNGIVAQLRLYEIDALLAGAYASLAKSVGGDPPGMEEATVFDAEIAGVVVQDTHPVEVALSEE